MDPTDWVGVATAGGTLALAGATGWLGWKTGQTVTEAAKARTVWERMAGESVKARLDASAPNVEVSVRSEWPPFAATHGSLFRNQLSMTEQWTVPKQNQERLALKARVTIVNRSVRTVRVDFRGDHFTELTARVRGHRTLESAQEHTVFLMAVFTLEQWAQNYRAAQEKQPLPHGVEGAVVVDDMSDEGVSDMWNLTLTGLPIEPNDDDAGKWAVSTRRDTYAVRASTSLRRRTYWFSRSRNEEVGL